MNQNNKNRCVHVSIFACLIALTFAGAAYAALPVASPDEGTKGTIFTITGSDFGEKNGWVFIGSERCQVLEWGDTLIECRIKEVMPPSVYDLMIKPKGGENVVILPSGFTIKAPMLDPPTARPHFVSPGDEITVTGAFFGEEIGDRKVQILDQEGDMKNCRILDWTMNQIMFRLPDTEKITGIFSLVVGNRTGSDIQHTWGTFAEGPVNPPNLLGSTYGGAETANIASAVTFNNKVWFFWPDKDGDDNHVQYQIWDGASNWSGTSDIVCNGETQKSKAAISPIAVHNVLYVFFTGLSGYLDYAIYNPLITDPTQRWQGKYTVANEKLTDPEGRFAAVYNFVNDTIEAYWSDATYVYMRTLNLKTNTWSGKRTVQIQIDPNNPNIVPDVDAVFNQTGDGSYVTYLTWADNYAGALTELKDGQFVHQTRYWYWKPYSEKRAPSVVDLGETRLAVIYYRYSYSQASYQKYDKTSRTVTTCVGQGSCEYMVPLDSQEDCGWDAEGVVLSTKAADGKSPTGYRMDTHFYAIVENNPRLDEANWELVKCEYLGYWMPTGLPNYVDFAGGDLSQEEANERMEDTFPNWPIIGIIDMPPFVRNGHEECKDWSFCGTEVEVNYSTTSTAGLSGEYSVGAYMETGKKSPVTFDASAGYAGGFENSTSFSYTQTAEVERNVDGAITALFLVPSFNVTELEWYDLNGAPTDIYTQAVEVVGAVVRKEGFEPEKGPVMSTIAEPYLDPEVFPMHGFEHDQDRLGSYWLNPTAAPYSYETIVDPAKSTSSWASGNSGGFKWAIDQEHSVDNGGYVEIKIGAEIGHKIGFGVEGSLEIMVNTTTQVGVEAVTSLKNQEPIDSDPSRIAEFSVEGYWLKPNANAYWVPDYRKGLGDAPWFLTYRVTDFWTLGVE